jgi:hypothetical protein
MGEWVIDLEKWEVVDELLKNKGVEDKLDSKMVLNVDGMA